MADPLADPWQMLPLSAVSGFDKVMAWLHPDVELPKRAMWPAAADDEDAETECSMCSDDIPYAAAEPVAPTGAGLMPSIEAAYESGGAASPARVSPAEFARAFQQRKRQRIELDSDEEEEAYYDSDSTCCSQQSEDENVPYDTAGETAARPPASSSVAALADKVRRPQHRTLPSHARASTPRLDPTAPSRLYPHQQRL
jgi:hypothetical protein